MGHKTQSTKMVSTTIQAAIVFAEFRKLSASFYKASSRVDLIKPLWSKFTYSLCNVDLLIAIQRVLLMFIKWSWLQKV
jgi:hypothetical protein